MLFLPRGYGLLICPNLSALVTDFPNARSFPAPAPRLKTNNAPPRGALATSLCDSMLEIYGASRGGCRGALGR